MDLIRPNGQPAIMGVLVNFPDHIDLSKYEYKTPYGRRLKWLA